MKMILASASPRRRELLHQVGLAPEIVPSDADETISEIRPEEVVCQLSRRKAEDVAEKLAARQEDYSDAVVIGADTIVSADGEILGKPGNEDRAVEMIMKLSGRSHQVYTGVTMIFTCTGEEITFAEATDVHVYPLTPEQARRYAATGEPLDKAGAYGIQGRFAAYVAGISGDYNNVVGLPVGRICQELIRRGYDIG